MPQVEWRLKAAGFLELAKTALQEGMEEELVVQITGLTPKEVRQLKKELDEQVRRLADRDDADTAAHGEDG